jgi:hypothetical protein
MISLRSRKWKIGVGVGGALALLAAVTIPGYASASALGTAGGASTVAKKLPAGTLGINVAPWNGLYANNSSGGTLDTLLKNAHINQIRYGGGLTADYYDWQTDTDLQACFPNTAQKYFTAACATKDGLTFSLLSKRARSINAQNFVTVNYGSGTPAEAAAWVKQAKKSGQQVGLWEIGNENYGCWEVNNELDTSPVNYKGYVINTNATCPMVKEGLDAGMATMATSYAVHAKQFITAMRAVNPKALIGVPYAFGPDVGGAQVGDAAEWDNVVLRTDAKYISFVDVHYYPEAFGGSTGGVNPTDQDVLQSLFKVPALYKEVRTELNATDPTAGIVVGETGVTYLATTIPCTPAGALFSAGDALSWLAAGAQGVDWWTMNSYGNTGTKCVNPDEGMFTSSTKPAIDTYYVGYLLASSLAQPSAKLSALATSEPDDVMAWQSVLPNGKIAVAFINTNTTTGGTVAFKSSLSGTLTKVSYSAGTQNAAKTKTVTTTVAAASVANGIALPAESMVVLKES